MATRGGLNLRLLDVSKKIWTAGIWSWPGSLKHNRLVECLRDTNIKTLHSLDTSENSLYLLSKLEIILELRHGQKSKSGLGVMAQGVRKLFALVEDLGFGSQHPQSWNSQFVLTPVPEGSETLFWPLRATVPIGAHKLTHLCPQWT